LVECFLQHAQLRNLYVRNMPPSWDDAKVAEIFSDFGEVSSSVLLTLGAETKGNISRETLGNPNQKGGTPPIIY
jgi:RNA recognition motif-containing protein